jgi:hypothetical protein
VLDETYYKGDIMKYAMLIRKSDLPLLTLLNGDVEPPLKPKTYLVFELDGRNVTSKVVTERELYNLGEISSNGPLLLKLKK